ncbi:response regulator receiver domain [Sulfurimonas sp. RIFOXYB12_FULL_35_9]|jgi:hypothetical protein|uniref:response regulator receiver domain n=1 Tax=Sulfurimonas sp. RIFOXYB12_FULL_35_9 TaxID=1802256 RepID=UPI0008CC83F2|nr:response regulator receiver domain [Sulfurimonas sp. RIFOXYB12_FULL_35_9]MDX9755974.1 response regulator receiver domain [Sulfurimonas sp.]OHE04944.1 MAG: hypothetical protein A2345_04140 [Sulfurimonas sp. RIFOXYB12_FULL_35_9]
MNEFLGISRGVVEDFLQTAVFLDDRAKYADNTNYSVVEKEMNISSNESLLNVDNIIKIYKTHGVIYVLKQAIDEFKIFKNPEKQDDYVETNLDEENPFYAIPPKDIGSDVSEHDLDAKTIVNTFMEKGIVCSVIQCEQATFEDKRESYIRLMKKADIIVLDWDLFADGGERIIGIIKDLINTDERLHELRSIVIYTANDLETVKSKLIKIDVKFEDNKYVSNNKLFTTVSLFNKESSSAIEARTAKFNELVEECIGEFTETFHGIVPNVAMASISEVRKNTHKLLGVLNKNLDPAYLSHRTLLEAPEDAERHIEEIIIGEIESMIHGSEIGKHAEIDKIKKAPIIQDKKYQNIDFVDCLKDGTEIKLDTGSKKVKKEKCQKFIKDIQTCYTKEWYLEEADAKISEQNFAVLSSLVTEYISNPYLMLGVIVEKASNKYLCMQPRCDSIRLGNETNFIFLQLVRDNKNFDIVLRDGSKYKLKYSLKNRQNFAFNPDSVAKKVLFTDSKILQGETEFRYIATLKRLHAQRIANEFSAYISRIGLNESEYIRRNSPRTLAGKI